MILPMILRAWQLVADRTGVRDLVFGGMLRPVYTGVVAGKNVSALPKGYSFTHPSPPSGPGFSETGPFFFVRRIHNLSPEIDPCALRRGT